MNETRLARREFIRHAAAGGAALLSGTGRASAKDIDLGLPSAPSKRALTKDFPQKGEMILQRVRPPLLETPFAVFDDGVFTPNSQFLVRWHLADIPDSIDVGKFRLEVKGLVATPLSLSIEDLMKLPRFEIAAVNQCSGNSRGWCRAPSSPTSRLA